MNREPLHPAEIDDRASLVRLEKLAWLMDRSIPLPGGFRIGWDGLLGLIPGIGDAAGALISAYIINEARRSGAPLSVILRMVMNVVVETVLGAIPVIGDLFDFYFKANLRNVELLKRHALRPR